MNNELAYVIRSGFHESTHYGHLVVTAPDGSVRLAYGQVDAPVFPRSSNKPFQASAMLAGGAELVGPDLALAAASHSGQPIHTERALALLERAGYTEDDLRCPPDLPLDAAAAAAAGGRLRRIYMNCSGKHAAMLLTCRGLGIASADYLDPANAYQQMVAQEISRLCGEPIAAVGVDGCGAPLMAISLTALARGFGACMQAAPGTAEHAVAAAMRAYPELVAGTGQDDTLVMTALPGVLCKGGADGIQVAGLPDGSAVALKVADGGMRARMPVLLAVLARLGFAAADLAELQKQPVLGGGHPVGGVELAPELARALERL